MIKLFKITNCILEKKVKAFSKDSVDTNNLLSNYIQSSERSLVLK